VLPSSQRASSALADISGLADTLRSEMLLHGIHIHLYVPAGILSPGFDNEQLTKPDITKKIEDGDTPLSPEACVGFLLDGRSDQDELMSRAGKGVLYDHE
jgi:3-dehydrosphinganine reductase